jgi:alpha-tubulin suppressor-like RCC1 family protein
VNEKITKIKAGAFNCAAFTEKEKVYMWGSTANGKMGVSRDNIEVPTEVCWQEKPQEEDYIELRTVVLKDEQKIPANAITKIRCIEWGEEHGLMLDKKGRLFGMGRTN